MKRVYCLYRVSTLEQLDKNNKIVNGGIDIIDDIPMQRQACHEFANQHGWSIIDEIRERGISGFKVSANDRDAILEIKKAAIAKKFDILLVFMFDRIGRIKSETPFVVEWFVNNGIEVWSVKEGQRRLETHEDSLVNILYFWQAEGESLKTSMRTKEKMGQIVQEGRYRGGTVPYGYQLVKRGRINKKGYEVHEIEVDPCEAEYVRLIFQKYVYEGYGIHRIINYLYDNGIYNHSGNRFSFSSIRAIIQNVIYTGILKSGDTLSNVFPHLKIIDDELFDRAQLIRKDRSVEYEEGVARRIPLNTKGEALMSGMAYCAHCGGRLCITTNVKSRTKIDGMVVRTKRIRYRCYNKTRKICDCDGQTEYTMEKLDGIISEVLFGLFKNIQALPESDLIEKRYQMELTSCINKHKGAKAELKRYTDTLSNLENEVVKALKGESKFDHDVLNGLVIQTREKISLASATAQQYELELNNRQQYVADIQAQYKELISWAEMFRHSPKETKKMIMAYLIESVKVRRGYELEVKFNIDYEQFCMVN